MIDIWAIILAAGESKRMKVPKMVLPFMGSTILEQVIENVINSQISKTVVVLGSDKVEIERVVKNWPVFSCFNEKYREGMLSSVKCGFRFLPKDFSAALVYPGDQPVITPEVTDLIISAYRASRKGIVIPVFDGRRGHPLLVAAGYREDILALDESEGLKALAGKFPDDVLEVETATPDILRDIDTEKDYKDIMNLTR